MFAYYRDVTILKEVRTKRIVMNKKERFYENQQCDGICPVKKTAEIIDGKWTTQVVRELLGGKKRYSEIQRALAGISPKVLTSRLRLLESKKLLTRTIYATVPPTTEYELTKLGAKLEAVIYAMAKFGEELGE